jgi:hypothetical protein
VIVPQVCELLSGRLDPKPETEPPAIQAVLDALQHMEDDIPDVNDTIYIRFFADQSGGFYTGADIQFYGFTDLQAVEFCRAGQFERIKLAGEQD